MAKIGVQAMMLKDNFAKVGPYETLRQVSEIGYHAVEISQIPMTPENVAELVRGREELGMDIASLSAGLKPAPMGGESLTGDFDKIVADAKTLDATMIRMGMLPFDAMASLDAVLEFCDAGNEMAARLQEHGIDLYYHNHHVEFAKYDGTYLLDIIADRAPLMGLEIDVHWVQRGGLDPVTTLKKYSDRVAMVHLKDYRIGQIAPESFEALGRGDFAAFMAASRMSCSSPKSARATSTSAPSSRPARRSGPSTCSSSRTSSTAALRSSACRPRTTTSSRSATPTSSRAPHPTLRR
jgi:sugar phosphate isomerase/epimerase